MKFKLKSGNTTPFKKMGASPAKVFFGTMKSGGQVDDYQNLDKKGRPKKTCTDPLCAIGKQWKGGLKFASGIALLGLAGDKITKAKGPSRLTQGMYQGGVGGRNS